MTFLVFTRLLGQVLIAYFFVGIYTSNANFWPTFWSNNVRVFFPASGGVLPVGFYLGTVRNYILGGWRW